jgi:hypothetical protein
MPPEWMCGRRSPWTLFLIWADSSFRGVPSTPWRWAPYHDRSIHGVRPEGHGGNWRNDLVFVRETRLCTHELLVGLSVHVRAPRSRIGSRHSPLSIRQAVRSRNPDEGRMIRRAERDPQRRLRGDSSFSRELSDISGLSACDRWNHARRYTPYVGNVSPS